MKAELILLTGILLISMLPAVSGLSVSCNDTATYSHGVVKFSCEVTGVQNNSTVRILGYYKNVQLFYRDAYLLSGENVTFNVSFRVKDVVPDELRVLPDYVFSKVKFPVYVTAYELRSQTTTNSANSEIVLNLKSNPKPYLSLFWALSMVLVFFLGPTMDYKSGWNFATEIIGMQFLFRTGGFWDVSAPFVYLSMSPQFLTNSKIEHSILALSGLSALFLLQSIYALGFHKAKYPRIGFYTGFEWIIGLPLAFYFIWPDDYVTPLFIGFLAGIPIFVLLWKYSELPYSKCSRELSLFKTYSAPLSVTVAIVIALNYTTGETTNLFILLLGILALYWFSSTLAFEKLEWAKKEV
ncbi:hypothetical protein [Thermococcus sp.]